MVELALEEAKWLYDTHPDQLPWYSYKELFPLFCWEPEFDYLGKPRKIRGDLLNQVITWFRNRNYLLVLSV